MTVQEQVKELLKRGILVSPDIICLLEKNDTELNKLLSGDSTIVLLDRESEQLIKTGEQDINWAEVEKTKVLLEKDRDSKRYTKVMGLLQKKTMLKGTVTVSESYTEPSQKYTVKDFVSLFNHRYKNIQPLLTTRPGLANPISISRANQRSENGKLSITAMVFDKRITKNENIILTLEDGTGMMTAMATTKNARELAKDTVPDEVIGVIGTMSNGRFMIDSIIQPDIPEKEMKKSPEDGYAIFLSDIHAGSAKFIEEEFSKFLAWINRRTGNDAQRTMAEQVKYIFIAGDLVDGVGIYPAQDRELSIKDIYRQYEKCAELLSQIPEDIQMIICPGNHDAMRMAEPQPALYQDYTKPVSALPNAILVSNPSWINIDSSENFTGFNVLLYHGYSFDHYVANVDSIRQGGGYDRADLIMKFLLKRRHLAPVHSSTLYMPDTKRDPLVIDRVPDLFVTGHIHKSSVSNYKNSTLICGSCWQSKTTFQERVGHHPEPARVPTINLKTRKAKILRFGK